MHSDIELNDIIPEKLRAFHQNHFEKTSTTFNKGMYLKEEIKDEKKIGIKMSRPEWENVTCEELQLKIEQSLNKNENCLYIFQSENVSFVIGVNVLSLKELILVQEPCKLKATAPTMIHHLKNVK